jgi:hypothetical protein
VLQNVHKIPKWKPRSLMTVYLGLSPNSFQLARIIQNFQSQSS